MKDASSRKGERSQVERSAPFGLRPIVIVLRLKLRSQPPINGDAAAARQNVGVSVRETTQGLALREDRRVAAEGDQKLLQEVRRHVSE